MHQIKSLLALRPARLGNVQLIGIDGHGGSGKSTLANYLADILKAEVIHIDDFASFDNPVHWLSGFTDHVLTPLREGATTLTYPRSSWWPQHQPEPVTNQPVTPIMIIEGVRALRTELRPYLSLSIFVATPSDICLARGLARDMTHSSETDARAHWEAWIQSETDYMQTDHPDQYADIIIDGTKSIPEQIRLD